MISYHTCPLASLEGKETGGMNVYVLELSKELAKQGYIVDIYTRSQDNSNKEIVEIGKNLRLIHLKAGLQKHIPKKQLINFIDDFVESFKQFSKKYELSYDLLHCHYYLSGLIGLKISQKNGKKIPVAMTFHTLALMKNLVARDEMEKEDKSRIDSEFLLIKKVDTIITPSTTNKEYITSLYNAPEEKITVVTPGVDTKLFKPMDKQKAKEKVGAGKNHKIVLFVGRIEPLKGIDVLMYAIKILLQKHPAMNLCLWIVGGDVSQKTSFWSKELQKLENLRELLGIKTIVKFVGQKPQTMLPYYYNAAEVVVMPSHYESFGMAALEAMACGIPVITTNVSGIASLIDDKHQALITTVNNPLMLASQIETLLTDEAFHKKIGKQVYETVQDLSWKNIAKATKHVYENLLSI